MSEDAGTASGAAPEDPAKRAADAERHKRKAERGKRRAKNRQRAVSWLKFMRALIRWMPLTIACALGDALGSVAWLLAGRARKKTLAHLALAMPELSGGERRRIGRRCFALLGRGMFAVAVSHRMGPARALAQISATDMANVRAALAEGKGALLLSFHYGCFELLAPYMAHEFKGRVVGSPTQDDGPTALLYEMREEMGCETIQRGDPRQILRALRDGHPISMLVDQDTDDVNGVFVPYFGRLAHTAIGPAALAVRTKAPVVLGFIEWTGLTRHRIYTLPLLHPRDDLPHDEAVLELTARITKLGEDAVRRRPDHWVWMHRRWETRPEDHPERPVYRGGNR